MQFLYTLRLKIPKTSNSFYYTLYHRTEFISANQYFCTSRAFGSSEVNMPDNATYLCRIPTGKSQNGLLIKSVVFGIAGREKWKQTCKKSIWNAKKVYPHTQKYVGHTRGSYRLRWNMLAKFTR